MSNQLVIPGALEGGLRGNKAFNPLLTEGLDEFCTFLRWDSRDFNFSQRGSWYACTHAGTFPLLCHFVTISGAWGIIWIYMMRLLLGINNHAQAHNFTICWLDKSMLNFSLDLSILIAGLQRRQAQEILK